MATSLGSAVLELEVDSAALKKGMKSAKGDVNASLKEMGMAMTVAGAVGVAAFGLAAKAAIGYDAQIAKTVGLTSASREEMDKLRQEVLKLAPAVGIGPKELADALYFVISAGIPAAEAMKVLEAAAKASASGLGETMVVADALTSAMNAYKASADEAGRYTDILTNIVKEGKTAPEELASSLGKVLPIAAAMGVSFEEVGANVALMTRVGFDAANATTYLRATLNALIKPSEQAKQMMGEVGLSFDDLREIIREKGLLAAFETMMELTDGNVAMLSQLFPNVQAVANILATAGSQGEAYNEVLASMYESTGLAGDAFEEMAGSTEFSMKQMKAQIESLMITVGSDLMPAIKDATTGFSALLSVVMMVPEPIRKVGTFAGVTSATLLLTVGMAVMLGEKFIKLGAAAIHLYHTLQKLAILKTIVPLLGPLGLAGALAISAVAMKKLVDQNREFLDQIPFVSFFIEGTGRLVKDWAEEVHDLDVLLKADQITMREYTEEGLVRLTKAAAEAAEVHRDKLAWALEYSVRATKSHNAEVEAAIMVEEILTGKLELASVRFIDVSESEKEAKKHLALYTDEATRATEQMLNMDVPYSMIRQHLIDQGFLVNAVTGDLATLEKGFQDLDIKGEAERWKRWAARLKEAAEEVHYSAEDLADYFRSDWAPLIEDTLRELEEESGRSFDDFRANFPDTIGSAEEMAAYLEENLPDVAESFETNLGLAETALEGFQEALEAILPEMEEEFGEWVKRLDQMAQDYNSWEGNLEALNAALVENTDMSAAEIDAAIAWFIDQGPKRTREFKDKLTDPMVAEMLQAVAELVRAAEKAPGDMGQALLDGEGDLALGTNLLLDRGIIEPLDLARAGLFLVGGHLVEAIVGGYSEGTVQAIEDLDRETRRMIEAGIREPATESPQYVTHGFGRGMGEDWAAGYEEGAWPAAEEMASTTEEVLQTGILDPLVGLRGSIHDLAEDALRGLNAKIAEEEDTLEGLEYWIDRVTDAQEAWRDEVDRISDSLDEANDRLRRFTDAAIEGTGAYDDAMFSLDMSMDRLKLKINELEQQKWGLDEESKAAKDLDEQIEALETELGGLRLEADALQLNERIRFEPLRRQIEKLIDTQEELTYDEIVAGIIAAQTEIEGLTEDLGLATDQVDTYGDALDTLNEAQAYHADLLGKAKEKYGELTAALKEIDPELGEIAESMGEGYAEALQNAFKAMEEGNTLAAEEALGVAQQLFDDIEELIEGKGQEQLVQPLGDILTEALGLVVETFGIKLPEAVAAGEEPLRESMASVLDGLLEELQDKMGWITFWANLTATDINANLMQTLHQMTRDLAEGNSVAVLSATMALAGYIDWLERNGYPGVAAVLKDINLLFRESADAQLAAVEGGVADIEGVFDKDLKVGVAKTAKDAMEEVVRGVETTGEEEMPEAADATMNALRMGMYAFQTEAGQWGAATMGWVASGMFTYMQGEGMGYARGVGRSFIEGIIEGLEQEKGSLYDKVTDIIEEAIDAANAAAGAASPAKRFMEMGANFARSLQMGWGKPTLDLGMALPALSRARAVSQTFAPSITVNAESAAPQNIVRVVRHELDEMWRQVQLQEPLGV